MPKIGKKIVHLSSRQRRRLIRKETNRLKKLIINSSRSHEPIYNVTEHVSCSPRTAEVDNSTQVNPNGDTVEESSSSGSMEDLRDEPNRMNSSNCSTESTAECEQVTNENKPDIRTAIQDFAITTSMNQRDLTRLLKLLKQYGHDDLPSNARTLLRTPRSTTVKDMPPGKYYHFGLADALTKSVLKYYLPQDMPSEIKYNINVDGLPLTKSSGSQFWPILTAIEAPFHTEPFVVGIYHGQEKPSDCNDFLQYFVEDTLTVCESGIQIENHKISCKLNVFICDAPAKAYITGTKGHNAYFGCSKCQTEGEFQSNRVIYPETNAALRTDDSFRSKRNEEYHKKRSILEDLNIGMVSSFPLDYLHLLCIGVMKKLLQFWVKGKKNVRMNPTQLKAASAHSLLLSATISKEFARKPRPLDQVDRFKATELRQLLLYTGPIIFQENLDKEKYYHFLSLSVAVRILSSKEHHVTLIDYARSLLIYFVSNFSKLYGAEHVSHNVHNLVHICDDVQSLGPLDSYSAFKYENFMQKIKKKVKTSNKPLQQFVNRIHEENHLKIKYVDNRNYLVIKFASPEKDSAHKRLIKSIQFKSVFLNAKKNNNCFLSLDRNIIAVESLFLENGKIFLRGKKYLNPELLFNKPCESSVIGVHVVHEKNYEIVVLDVKQIKQKCLKLTINKRQSAIMPLVHDISN